MLRAQLRSVLEMDPGYPRAGLIDEAYLEAGRSAELLAHLEAWDAVVVDTPWAWSEKAYVYGRLGRAADARASLNKLLGLNRAGGVDPIVIAMAYLGLRDVNYALDWLEKAYAEHSFSLTALKVNPNSVPAHLLQAELALDDRERDAARESIKKALAVNPNSLEARSLVAAIARLDDQSAEFEKLSQDDMIALAAYVSSLDP